MFYLDFHCEQTTFKQTSKIGFMNYTLFVSLFCMGTQFGYSLGNSWTIDRNWITNFSKQLGTPAKSQILQQLWNQVFFCLDPSKLPVSEKPPLDEDLRNNALKNMVKKVLVQYFCHCLILMLWIRGGQHFWLSCSLKAEKVLTRERSWKIWKISKRRYIKIY